MDLGRNRAEVELTQRLAATLVREQVMEPMAAIGWGHGAPPTPEQIAAYKAAQTPSGDGQPGIPKEAPTGAVAPVAPVQSGQPVSTPNAPVPAAPVKTDAPVDAAAAQNVVALFESLRDPATGLIMGKYVNVTEALKGAGHLANMAKGALGRAEAAEAALTAARTQTPIAAPPVAAPATAPAKREYTPVSRTEVDEAQARLDKVLSKMEDGEVFNGDSAREFAQATRELARAEGRAAAEDDRRRAEHAKDAEQEQWDAVSKYMAEKYPDSPRFSDEVGLYVKSNPLLTEVVQTRIGKGQILEAAELAWVEFDKARGGSGVPNLARAEAERVEQDLAAREQVRKELRDQALKDAGIVHSSVGGGSAVETPGIVGPSQDDINKLADGMRREGDSPGSRSAAQWRHAVIGRFLPPDLFPQG